MTRFDLQRYVAKETAVSVVVSLLVSTGPSLLVSGLHSHDACRPVRDVAVGLTPSFFMAALMSALVPLLSIRWKQARGRLGMSRPMPRFRLDRVALIAFGLAIVSTIVALALIRVIVAPLAAGGLDSGVILTLRGGQAAFAAATVTPSAILLLFRRTWQYPGAGRDLGASDLPEGA